MYKDYELSVAAAVPAASPTEYIRTFPPCVIERLVITFPKGPNREVYVRVWHEALPVFPSDPKEWVNGEDESVTITGPWSNWDELYRLRIQMCAPDARLPHKVIFRFNLAEVGLLGAIRTSLSRLESTLLPT